MRPVVKIGLLLGALVVLGLVAKSILFTKPVPQRVEEASVEKSRSELIDEAQVVAQDVELVQGRKGAMEWKLLAKTAKYNQEKKLVGVTDPRLTAFYGKDRREVFIRADRGEVDQAKDNLTLYDNVTGRFGGLDIYAPFLDYVGGEDKVYIRGGVHVKRTDLDMTADEAEIDLESRVLIATGKVNAVLNSIGVEK